MPNRSPVETPMEEKTLDRNDEWTTCPCCLGEGKVGMEQVGKKFVAGTGRTCPLCDGAMGFGDAEELARAVAGGNEALRRRLRDIAEEDYLGRLAKAVGEICPTCGSRDRFVVKGICASDTHDPHDWHRGSSRSRVAEHELREALQNLIHACPSWMKSGPDASPAMTRAEEALGTLNSKDCCLTCGGSGEIVLLPSKFDTEHGESRRWHEPCPDCTKAA